MAALFPTNPLNGDYALVNGITYVYASSTQSWTRVPGAGGGGGGGGSSISNGTSSVDIPQTNGDIFVSSGGVANVAVFSVGSLTLSGTFGTPKQITSNIIVANNINAMLIGPMFFANNAGITIPNGSTVYVYSPQG